MSKILLIAAAALLLGSAALSFLNKNKMAEKAAEIGRANGVVSAAQAEAAKAKTTLKTAEKSLADEKSRAAELDTKLAAASNELAKAKDEAAATTAKLADNAAEITRLNDALKIAPGGPRPVSTTPDADALDRTTKERDELKLVKDGQDTKIKGLEDQVASLRREAARHVADTERPGLRGKVLAVDRNWNFVVLSLGDRNGVNSNTTMVVRRGESLVGRVRITSVEPSQSIADIVPNSVPPGVSVQAGDTVIFPGGS